jgi:hypothetical protein
MWIVFKEIRIWFNGEYGNEPSSSKKGQLSDRH